MKGSEWWLQNDFDSVGKVELIKNEDQKSPKFPRKAVRSENKELRQQLQFKIQSFCYLRQHTIANMKQKETCAISSLGLGHILH